MRNGAGKLAHGSKFFRLNQRFIGALAGRDVPGNTHHSYGPGAGGIIWLSIGSNPMERFIRPYDPEFMTEFVSSFQCMVKFSRQFFPPRFGDVAHKSVE